MKKLLFLILILLIGVWAFLFFGPFFNLELSEIRDISIKVVELAEKKISIPPPLKIEKENHNPFAILKQQEIIDLTNKQRQENGLTPLRENFYLNISAEQKIDDMLENQYFAHSSPTGEGAGDLAKKVGYEFILVGENLAIGNFESNQELVDAWMESPGHRENIVSRDYQEIGIAVKKGIFNGKEAWMAVQHFALPVSACPKIDETIKDKIEQKEKEVRVLQNEISELRSEIESIRIRWGSGYNQKLQEYNNLVEEYNKLLSDIRLLINQYNNQVQVFNECVAQPR